MNLQERLFKGIVASGSMGFRPISFKGFDGREEALRSIKRYSMYAPMFYRTDVFLHSQRTLWITEELLPLAIGKVEDFDAELARSIAAVHDDAEMITGDVQLGHKIRMTPKQLQKLDADEEAAIEILAERSPTMLNGFLYKKLLLHALRKDCPEAQLAKCADRIDAFGESMHELFAGNKNFIEPVQVYTGLVKGFPRSYKHLTPVFTTPHALLTEIQPDIPAILAKATFHTPDSVMKDSGYPLYDRWKKLTIAKVGISLLVAKKEDVPSNGK